LPVQNTLVHGLLALLGCEEPGAEYDVREHRGYNDKCNQDYAASRPVNASAERKAERMVSQVLISLWDGLYLIILAVIQDIFLKYSPIELIPGKTDLFSDRVIILK
jgi:hypothetical protein